MTAILPQQHRTIEEIAEEWDGVLLGDRGNALVRVEGPRLVFEVTDAEGHTATVTMSAREAVSFNLWLGIAIDEAFTAQGVE